MVTCLGKSYHFLGKCFHFGGSIFTFGWPQYTTSNPPKKSWQGSDPSLFFGNVKILRAPITPTPPLGNSLGFDLILMMTDTLTQSMIVFSSSISAFLTQLMIVDLNVILWNRKVTECCHWHQIKFSISVKCFQIGGSSQKVNLSTYQIFVKFSTPTHI